MRNVCSIEGCDRFVQGRGLCPKHYTRWIRYGDVEYLSRDEPGTPLEKRVRDPKKWLMVERGYITPCQEWIPKNKSVEGYGRIKYKGRSLPVHRLMYEFEYGVIPADTNVLHKCDNPPCARPDHLMTGTQAENIQDMVSKGRQRARRSKTDEQIRAIRVLAASGMKQTEIAQVFSIDSGTVSRIVNRLLYKDVE